EVCPGRAAARRRTSWVAPRTRRLTSPFPGLFGRLKVTVAGAPAIFSGWGEPDEETAVNIHQGIDFANCCSACKDHARTLPPHGGGQDGQPLGGMGSPQRLREFLPLADVLPQRFVRTKDAGVDFLHRESVRHPVRYDNAPAFGIGHNDAAT